MTSVCSWPALLACLVIRKPPRFWPKARRKAKTRQGPSFAQQKFFAPCLTSLVLSERGGAKEGEGGRPGRKGGVLRNEFRMAGWPTCYEREFEPKTIGLNVAARVIACMTKVWFHRPLQQVASIRGLAKLHSELELAAAHQQVVPEPSWRRHRDRPEDAQVGAPDRYAGLLELRRTEVAQRRVDPSPVVDDLDVLEQVQGGLLARGVGTQVHTLRFHDAHGRFNRSALPRRRDRPPRRPSA